MVITSGNFPAGKFQINITPQGVGLLVRVTNRNTDGWIEGKHWFTSVSLFADKVAELAYLIGGSEQDQAEIRKVVGRLAQ